MFKQAHPCYRSLLYLGTFSVKYLLRGKERLQICDEEKNAGVV